MTVKRTTARKVKGMMARKRKRRDEDEVKGRGDEVSAPLLVSVFRR